MKIVFSSNELANRTDPLWENLFTVDGKNAGEVIPSPDQSAPFLRDAGNGTQTLSFEVKRIFASHVLAQVAQLALQTTLPASGPITITCGEGLDVTQDVFSANALLDGLNITRVGVSLTIRYHFICQPFTTSIPPGFVVASTMRQFTRLAVTAAAETATWTFPVAFGAGVKPRVGVTVEKPDSSSPDIFPNIIGTGLDNAHADIHIGAPALGTGYFLHITAEF